MIELPFLNLNIKCNAENKKKDNKGMVTGCHRTLSNRLPFSNSTKLRCSPHPGQLMCRKNFHGQGNWCFSSQFTTYKKMDVNKSKYFDVQAPYNG